MKIVIITWIAFCLAVTSFGAWLAWRDLSKDWLTTDALIERYDSSYGAGKLRGHYPEVYYSYIVDGISYRGVERSSENYKTAKEAVESARLWYRERDIKVQYDISNPSNSQVSVLSKYDAFLYVSIPLGVMLLGLIMIYIGPKLRLDEIILKALPK